MSGTIFLMQMSITLIIQKNYGVLDAGKIKAKATQMNTFMRYNFSDDEDIVKLQTL